MTVKASKIRNSEYFTKRSWSQFKWMEEMLKTPLEAKLFNIDIQLVETSQQFTAPAL